MDGLAQFISKETMHWNSRTRIRIYMSMVVNQTCLKLNGPYIVTCSTLHFRTCLRQNQKLSIFTNFRWLIFLFLLKDPNISLFLDFVLTVMKMLNIRTDDAKHLLILDRKKMLSTRAWHIFNAFNDEFNEAHRVQIAKFWGLLYALKYDEIMTTSSLSSHSWWFINEAKC